MTPFRTLGSGLAGWLLCAAVTAAADLVALDPGEWVPGEATPPARSAPGGGVLLPLPFDAPNAPDRVYWDIPIQRLDPGAAVLEVDLSCDDPAALRALSLHLHSGNGWLSAQQVPEAAGRQTLRFQRDDFTAEDGHPLWNQSTRLRLSLWNGAPRGATLILHSIRLQTPSIAILRGTELTAPGESDLAIRCAARALRLFGRAGLPATLLSDDFTALDLKPFHLLVLPYNPALAPPQLDLLERFVQRGGRLAVFYNANNRLAQLLGFSPLPYSTQSENWTTVSFIPSAAHGLPASMSHLTQHLLPIRANSPDAITLGRWLTSDGIVDRSLPAAVVSPRGFWFSHLPPLASPSALQWLLASMAASNPDHRPALDRFLADAAQRDAQAAAQLGSAPAAPTEIRAVWTLPIPSRLREETLGTLSTLGINTVFENFVSLADDLPNNRSLQKRISRAVAVARTHHLQWHVWVVCWSLDGAPSHRIAALRDKGILMQDVQGHDLPWLCPIKSAPLLTDTLATLAHLGVDGIHLDYLRYPARDGCYCPLHRALAEKRFGAPIENWPDAVLPGRPRAAEYETSRRESLTATLAAAADLLHTTDPKIRLSVAVYPTPEAAAENGQDWPAWLRDGRVDFVSPMLYADDASRFADQLDRALAAAPAPSTLLPGIGTGADESQLDALAAAQQIVVTRQKKTAGYALFQLDSDLVTRILPILAP